MSHQLEITFSYGEKTTKARTMRRDVNWPERFDDLFAGVQASNKSELPLKSAGKPGSGKPEDTKTNARI